MKLLLKNLEGILSPDCNSMVGQASILINNGKIERIIHGPANLSEFDNQTQIIPMYGKFALPAFINNHLHATAPFSYSPKNWQAIFLGNWTKQIQRNLFNQLKQGVTLGYDKGSFIGRALNAMGKLGTGEWNGIDIVTTGPMFTCKNGYPQQSPILWGPLKWHAGGNFKIESKGPNNLDYLRKQILEYVNLGVHGIKIAYQGTSYSDRKIEIPKFSEYEIFCITENIPQDMRISVHTPYKKDILNLLGIAERYNFKRFNIEHTNIQTLGDSFFTEDEVKRMVDAEFHFTPTICVVEDYINWKTFYDQLCQMERNRDYSIMRHCSIKEIKHRLECDNVCLTEKQKRLGMIQRDQLIKGRDASYDFLEKIRNAGGIVKGGTDAYGYELGFGNDIQREVNNLLNVYPISDILRIFTQVNANGLGIGPVTLEKGNRADIMILGKNPLITESLIDVNYTIKKGKIAYQI